MLGLADGVGLDDGLAITSDCQRTIRASLQATHAHCHDNTESWRSPAEFSVKKRFLAVNAESWE